MSAEPPSGDPEPAPSPSEVPDAKALPEARVVATRPLGLEVLFVTLLSFAFLVPGIWTYTLVDPWETHYAEVSRRMLQDHDWVQTKWQDEGFRSKPVLTFWLMAGSLRAFGLGADGGYSGEMVSSPLVMLAIRLPFVLFGVLGLVMTWWMLARLVGRRVAYLALLVIGTTPFYTFVARQGITDMTLVGCMMGAVAMFAMATEAGTDPLRPLGRFAGLTWDARHLFFAIIGAFLAWQALYYLFFFITQPQLAVRWSFGRVRAPSPGLVLFLGMVVLTASLHHRVWRWVGRPLFNLILVLAVIAAELKAITTVRYLAGLPLEKGSQFFMLGVTAGIGLVLGLLLPIIAWRCVEDRRLPDAILLRLVLFTVHFVTGAGGLNAATWQRVGADTDRAVQLEPLTTWRQLYMLWFSALLGVSVLGKGLPALGIVGVVCFFYVLLLRRWRDLLGAYEIKRGALIIAALAVPWHIGMWLKEGPRFISEYFIMHLLNRAAVGVFGERGTFDFYMSQLGAGMFVWAGLVPIAVGAMVVQNGVASRVGRVRLIIVIWAITSVAFFSLVQTKFHHYILPAVPALGILIAFWFDDILAGRARPNPILCLLGAGIVLLVTRDLMHEEKQWIEMFIFRYDRPWPSGPPYSIDTSDGFLALGLAGAAALIVLAVPRLTRLGIALTATAALATALWSMHVYMPIAATHWGMRDAIRAYYESREIHGQKLVYYGPRQLADDWAGSNGRRSFETFVPDHLYVGQPMTFTVVVRSPDDRPTQEELRLTGPVTAIGDHTVEVALPATELTKLGPLIEQGRRMRRATRPPVRVVDADRLFAWQLYWRGENFWSGDEIFGRLPEMKTALKESDNIAFLRYLNDMTIAIPGRRYFVVTESGRTSSLRSILPTARAKETFEVINTTSNKFSLASFVL